jgi:hypothetical protein
LSGSGQAGQQEQCGKGVFQGNFHHCKCCGRTCGDKFKFSFNSIVEMVFSTLESAYKDTHRTLIF